MTTADHDVDALMGEVLVVVPAGGATAGPLLAAIERHHPGRPVRTVWAGDPQLCPPDVGPPRDRVDELELAAIEPDAVPAFIALQEYLREPVPTIVLVAGSVAVAGSIDALQPEHGRLTVVPRLLAPSSDEGHPAYAAIADVGGCSGAVFGLGIGADDAARWIAERLTDPEPAPIGTLLDLAATMFPATRCRDDRIGISCWRWGSDRPALIEAPRYDRERPWLLDPDLDGPPRVSLADPVRRDVVGSVADQLGKPPLPLSLPGAVPIDDVVRSIVRSDPPAGLRPWSDATAFREFVGQRYWDVAHRLRPSLGWRFPSPHGADAAGFASWARHAAFVGEAPLLLDPSVVTDVQQIHRTEDRTDGVNLVGYFRHQSGIGNIARRVAEMLRRHGIPHSVVSYDRTESPRLAHPPHVDQELRYATSLVFVNGDSFEMFRHDVPEVFGPGRRVIGLWYWELETLAGAAPVGDRHVDEIWAASTFMARPFEELASAPVRVVPIPFERPVPSGRARDEFAPLSRAAGRFVFGLAFDHLSVTARKNPLGAIAAFERAFDPGEGPLLVVKTINGARCWREHEELVAAASGRPDIVVWDEHLDRPDQLAFIAALDTLVSLHRSEGLGLHLAEAMWLGTPVLATRYSGNLDFMDDRSAVLVDAELVEVGSDGGWAYPASARWAAPDHDAAARAMRRLAAEPEWARSIGVAARQRIERHADESAFVRTVQGLLRR